MQKQLTFAPNHQEGIELSNVEFQIDLPRAIELLEQLPYRISPLSSRHWGNKLHELCSFPSKLKPSIAHLLVHLFTKPNDVVMDPFTGSGTVPLEAGLGGRRSISSDISPLAFVVTSAKTNMPSYAELELALRQFSAGIDARVGEASLAEMEAEITTFYHERTALEIVAARRYLREVTADFMNSSENLFLTACLAHVLHGNRPYALSRRSHNIIPIPPKGPTEYKSVAIAVANKAQRMLKTQLPPEFKPGEVFLSSADCIPVGDAIVDVIITSPPFLGSTDFLRQNRLRNWLVGWDYVHQQRMKTNFLDHDTRLGRYEPIARELYRITKPGGTMVMHLGIVRGQDMAAPLIIIFEDNGWKKVGLVWEDVNHLESHGRVDRGGTAAHGFLVMSR